MAIAMGVYIICLVMDLYYSSIFSLFGPICKLERSEYCWTERESSVVVVTLHISYNIQYVLNRAACRRSAVLSLLTRQHVHVVNTLHYFLTYAWCKTQFALGARSYALVRLGRGALLRSQTYAQTDLPCDELAGRSMGNCLMRWLQLQAVHRAHQFWAI